MKKILIVTAVIIVFFGVGFFGMKYWKNKTEIPKRQAVFLNNGQVYFGYITSNNSQTLKLSDVYYLKIDDLQSADPNKKVMLVKMGNELHRPADIMYINQSQILFYQPINDQSKINDAISKAIQKAD